MLFKGTETKNRTKNWSKCSSIGRRQGRELSGVICGDKSRSREISTCFKPVEPSQETGYR